jgi:transcriptional regulator, tetR family
MPNFTKQAIKASFIKLLNERPLNQITVKDIVEDCGINRNSFYYHFADLPALLEEVIMEQADNIINEYPSIDSMEMCMDAIISFALKNKKAVYHIFNSVNRGMYEHYLLDMCHSFVDKYINTTFGELPFAPYDKEIIITFYSCECFGQIINWISGGMKADIQRQSHRLFELRRGMIEELVKRSVESNR